ncbi:hypothetical protein MASR2M78_15010 [Treponema sp.]
MRRRISLQAKKESIKHQALGLGFCSARILSSPGIEDAASLLLVGLAYGNDGENERCVGTELDKRVHIAPFARKNYYAEAVYRLKALSRSLREEHGGKKADYRIFCNSSRAEKPLAARSGLGAVGRNSLIISKEAGSLLVLAAMCLPFALEGDPAIQGDFSFCSGCGDAATAPCVLACPTQALNGDGTLIRERCIQWYASGNRQVGMIEVPDFVASQWGRRLYGCTNCQDACPHNKRPLRGAEAKLGELQSSYDALSLLSMSDEELTELFKGSALGMSWLGTEILRENIRLALRWMEAQAGL